MKLKTNFKKIFPLIANVFFGIGIVAVLVLTNSNSFGHFNAAQGDVESYKLVLDDQVVPVGLDDSAFKTGSSQDRYVDFAYGGAKLATGHHVILEKDGFIKNKVETQITSILSVKAVFSNGVAKLHSGLTVALGDEDTLTSGVTKVFNDYPYYISFVNEGVDPLTLTSLEIEYSCAPIYSTVTFQYENGSPNNPVQVLTGGKVVKPADPTKTGNTFDGWTLGGDAYNFDSKVLGNITLVATWKQNALPKLPTPVNGANINPSTTHIGIGVYAGGPGYTSQLKLVFTNQTTLIEYTDTLNAPAGAGYAYHYNVLNLPYGNYVFKFKALGDNISGVDSDYYVHSVQFNIPMPNLAAPVLNVDTTAKTLSWGAVANATSYDVYINNVIALANATSPYDLSGIVDPGEYSLKVVAKATGYNDSNATKQYIIIGENTPQLAAPTNLALNVYTLSWDAVANAVNYKVTIGGVSKTYASSVTSIDVGDFDKSGAQTLSVVAIGDKVNYLDSDAATINETIQALLPRLNSMAVGDQNGNINGYGGGYYNLVVHVGHAPFQQADWNSTFRFEVWDGTNKLGELIGGNNQSLHVPKSTTDFYGAILTDGNVYKLHIILLAKPDSGHRESLPFIHQFTYTKG